MNATKFNTLLAALLVAGLAGCNGDDGDATAATDIVPPATNEPIDTMPPAGIDTMPEGGEGTITVANYEGGGSYIADSAGNSVYMLEDETDGTVCVGDCLDAWPPVLVTDMQPTVATGVDLDPALLGTIERADGTMQVTYNGHPLYRYAADTGTNRTAGHGIEDQWGHWYLVTPTGMEFDAEMTADASASLQADSATAEDATSDDMPADGSAIEEGTGDDY